MFALCPAVVDRQQRTYDEVNINTTSVCAAPTCSRETSGSSDISQPFLSDVDSVNGELVMCQCDGFLESHAGQYVSSSCISIQGTKFFRSHPIAFPPNLALPGAWPCQTVYRDLACATVSLLEPCARLA